MRTRLVKSEFRRGDRGAVLIIVAAFAVVAVAFLAIVINLGDLRQEKKEVTLSTDAAALAAAAVADTEDVDLLSAASGTLVDCIDVGIAPDAPNPDLFTDVQDAVDDYLFRNGQSNPVDCKVARTSFKQGYVLVSADEIVDFSFSGATGVDSGAVAGVSVAAIEVDPGGGLRPIGICGVMQSLIYSSYPVLSLTELWNSSSGGYDLDSDGYVVLASSGLRETPTVRFGIEKVKGGSCGGGSGPGGSGNFGKLDFGGGTSTSCTTAGYFCKDLADGYFGPVSDPTNGDTGNNWGNTATEGSMNNLENNVGLFWSPVFSSVANPGGNADFRLAFYLQLEAIDHCFTGACSYTQPGDPPSDETTWFDFRITRMVPYSPAGPPLTDDATYKPPRLCAVTGDPSDIDEGCPKIGSGPSTTIVGSTTTVATTSTTTTTTSTPPSSSSTTQACAGTLNVNWPENYNSSQDRVNKDLTASYSTSGSCGTLTLVLIPPSGTSQTFATSPQTSGTVANNDSIWSTGQFRVELRNNGTALQTSSKTYS